METLELKSKSFKTVIEEVKQKLLTKSTRMNEDEHRFSNLGKKESWST